MSMWCCKAGVLTTQCGQAENDLISRSELESSAEDGDSPVGENNFYSVIPFLKYHGTREIP